MTIETSYWMIPIPCRKYDWSACSSDYEAGDPIGYGETEEEAIARFKEIVNE